MRTLFSFILLFSSLAIFSQNQLIPIRQNHQWGFLNARGDIAVEPQFDAIGEQNIRWNRGLPTVSRFRLFKKNEKLGLINREGETVLDPAYTAIRPLNDTIFAVRVDSLFTVVNREGNILIDQRYEDIRLIQIEEGFSDEYFMVLNDTLWGVFHRDEGLVFEPQFGFVKYIDKGDGFFKIKKSSKEKFWGLINREGDQILPFEYQKIEVYHPNFIAALNKTGQWGAWDKNGEELLESIWWKIRPLNKHVAAIQNRANWFVYVFENQKLVEFNKKLQGISRLNDSFVRTQWNEKFGIVDSLGNEVLEPTFSGILPAPPPFFRVKKSLWGLFSFEKGIVVPTIYQAIGDFENDLAIVKKNGKMGMININGKVIIPAEFDSFQTEENFLKAFVGKSMTIFELDDNNEIVNQEYYPEVYSMRVGFNVTSEATAFNMGSIRAAARGSRLPTPPRVDRSDSDSWNLEDSRWEWRKSKVNSKWGLWDKEENRAASPNIYRSVRHIRNGKFTLVFNSNETVVNKLSTMAVYPVDTACLMAIFSHEKGDFITPFNMMGLRKRDFEDGRAYAVFIDRDGKYGLIDRNGKPLKKNGAPLKFDFIGEFERGKARFCNGGRISVAEQPNQKKLQVAPFSDFNRSFYVTPSRRFDLRHFNYFYFDDPPGNAPEWGYLDTLGNVVIEAEYQFASSFRDSLTVNKKDEHWGLINERNETVIPFEYAGISKFNSGLWKLTKQNSKPIFFNKKGYELIGLKYSKFGGFHGGMCRVKVDSLWGFVNERGEEVLPCQYTDARNFSEGLAAVKIKEDWYFINKDGKIILKPSDNIEGIIDFGSFKDERCWYKVGQFYGFIDKTGKSVIEPKFTKVFDFQEGIARAVFNAKTGLINPKGKWILKPKDYGFIQSFQPNGLAEVRKHFKLKRGILNSKGKLITPLKYDEITPFINGFAKVKVDDLYGMIDEKGREVLPVMYAAIGEMHDGLVPVMLPRKLVWHYRNTKNERAFKGNFELAKNFDQGHAFVQVHEYDLESKMWINTKGKPVNPAPQHQVQHYSDGIFGMYDSWGERNNFSRLNYYYSDLSGRNIFNRYYEDIAPFKKGTAPIKSKTRWGVIDEFGMTIVQAKYSRINQLPNDLIHVRPGVVFGLATYEGEVIFNPQFDYLERYNNLIRVEKGENLGYLNTDGTWFWELQN